VITGPWKDREEFETWWKAHVIAINRLSVVDPPEWQRVCRAIEQFNTEHPQ
jgi:hypothetical protein